MHRGESRRDRQTSGAPSAPAQASEPRRLTIGVWLPILLCLGLLLAAPHRTFASTASTASTASDTGDRHLPPAAAAVPEPLVVLVTVNQVGKGDRFVYRDDTGFYLKTSDLIDFGLSDLPAARRVIDGAEVLPLHVIPRLDYRFDEATLTLALTASPEILPASHIDFHAERRPGVIFPRDTGGFFNYGVGYSATGEDDVEHLVQATGELGWRSGDLLLLTDGGYSDSPDENRFVRLNTRLIRDDRTTLQRFTLGDLVADTGILGSRLNLGGIGITKVFAIDPYYTQQPLFHFAGLTQLPATVEVYQDGNRIRTEKIDPGQFSIDNLRTTLGARDIQIVVRDALGRETLYSAPYYFADQLLRAGLHEYSYNLGAIRQDYGTSSADYAHLAWAAFHRYGLTDDLTLGGHTEGGDGLANLGTSLLLRLGPFGVASLDAAASSDDGESGVAGGLGFEYLGQHWQSRLQLYGLSSGYATLGNRSWGEDYAYDLAASIGYLDRTYGSLTLSYLSRKPREESAEESIGLSYTRNLGTWAFLSASYTHHSRASDADDEVMVSFNYYLDRDSDITVAASHRHDRETDRQEAEIRRNVPEGEGYGWRGTVAREHGPAGTAYEVNPFVQYNGQHGSYRAEYSYIDRPQAQDDHHQVDVSAAGAIVALGGSLGLTRPVQDSFGLVKVGEVENVRVYVNNREIGRTGKDGTLFIPELSSYFDNQVRIEDQDIPLDYLMGNIRQDISPPLRSGSCVNFPLQRYQAFTGTLQLLAATGQPLDLANGELTLQVDTWSAAGMMDSDGSFYVEIGTATPAPADVGCAALGQEPPAAVGGSPAQLLVWVDGTTYSCPLVLPAADGPVTELGAMRCTVGTAGEKGASHE